MGADRSEDARGLGQGANLGASVLPTLAEVTLSAAVLEPVADDLDPERTWRQLRRMLDVQVIADTALIEITATTSDANEATGLADAVGASLQNVAPSLYADASGASTLRLRTVSAAEDVTENSGSGRSPPRGPRCSGRCSGRRCTRRPRPTPWRKGRWSARSRVSLVPRSVRAVRERFSWHHEAAAPLPTFMRDSSQRVIAVVALFAVGLALPLPVATSTALLASLALLPAWVGALRRYRGATLLVTLTGLGLLLGLLLAWMSAVDHAFAPREALETGFLISAGVGCVGLVLWARTLLPVSAIGVAFGSANSPTVS